MITNPLPFLGRPQSFKGEGGETMTFGTFEPDPIPRITGAGSEVPLLILGSTRDGSTIVQWTARMSRAFPASRTVTYAGGQHVTWGAFAGSACLDRVANRYVIETVLPATDRGCPNSLAVAQ